MTCIWRKTKMDTTQNQPCRILIFPSILTLSSTKALVTVFAVFTSWLSMVNSRLYSLVMASWRPSIRVVIVSRWPTLWSTSVILAWHCLWKVKVKCNVSWMFCFTTCVKKCIYMYLCISSFFIYIFNMERGNKLTLM